ncbi:MAG: class I SAM-dependent methyltransferase [Nitrospira sp.]|nr:class I SAM-dependent methyltransferase [Nitrospira sp.]MBS0153702.1 class I SAM-dependent methyltransferase [Nitrospira sp.]MBS0164866.1 class I SAM-dependent methyltransferase [Nitrospira sp.]
MMRLYCKHIFPRLMDHVMRGTEFSQLRTKILQSVAGEVLEIGIGTGLNLAHYGPAVSRVQAVDPIPMLPTRMAERRAAVPFPVEITLQSAERLPYEDRTFDCVVSTWTLCTIPDPVRALQEVRRVLKPEGIFLFLEHGRSDDRKIAAWQDRLNPIQNVIGCGCNLNRRIDDLITQAGLAITQLDRFAMQGVPRLGGEMYRGTAVGQG